MAYRCCGAVPQLILECSPGSARAHWACIMAGVTEKLMYHFRIYRFIRLMGFIWAYIGFLEFRGFIGFRLP